MAGAGYKLFNTGDVLTAAQVNTYLQEQTVMVFADAAARTTALSGVLSEGMITYLKDTNAVEKYTGSAWVNIDTGSTSPLTTKGDLYTYSTADTRLAVGSNGDTLLADSSTSTGLRWQGSMAAGKNAVINGGFDIWQRGTSIATTGSYTADRFNTFTDSTGNRTVSRQATADTTNLPNIQYSARFQRTAGDTSTSRLLLGQSLESSMSIPFVGKTVTLSFYARAGANYSSSSSVLGLSINTGTGTDQNVFVGFTGQVSNTYNFTLTTTWQRFSQTVTIPTTATQIGFYVGYTPSGTAGANDWYEVTGIQLELGSVPTTFTRAGGTLAGELAACQRYYWRSTGTNAYTIQGYGMGISTTQVSATVNLPAQMRTTPSSVDYASLAVFKTSRVAGITGVSITSSSNTNIAEVTYTTSSTVADTFYRIANDNSASGYIGFSAEL